MPRRRQTLSTSLSDVTESPAEDDDVDEASAVRDCGDGGGGGACFVFDRVPTRAMADVQTLSVKFEGNHALVGGNTPILERQRSYCLTVQAACL